ncbi:glycosyltransferase family 9 protein, partial [Acinetobacter baumannii]
VMLFHNETTHKVAQLGAFMKLRPVPGPRIYVAPAHEAAAVRLIPAGGPVLAIAPTANWIGKIWPAERFVEAIARLTAADGILPDARIAVFGG